MSVYPKKRLDTIVPPEMSIEMIPIYDIGTFISKCIAVQPEPSRESGRPRLIKAK